MTFFQEVYDRIQRDECQNPTELAAVLNTAVKYFGMRSVGIRSFRDRETVRKVRAQPRLDQERHRPDVPEDRSGILTPVEGPPEGFHEEPAHYVDPNAISTLTKVYSTQCAYEEGHPAPDLQTSGKIALPQSYVNAQTLVFHIESDSFSRYPPRGLCRGGYFAYAPHFRRRRYAVYMPHEGVALAPVPRRRS